VKAAAIAGIVPFGDICRYEFDYANMY